MTCSLVNDEPSNIASSSSRGHQNEEYVWDVFYHRPAITALASVSNIATMCVTHSSQNILHVSIYYRTGLPPGENYDSESESDSAGDEEDEDSNSTHNESIFLFCVLLFNVWG